jgi:endonuclease III
MKNATKFAEELKHLHKRIVKEYKPGEFEPLEPLEALVRGAMSYDVSDTRAEDAMKAIGREFVDLNELRVATDLEIQELLGVKYPAIEHRVAMITQCLNQIFEREHTLSLDRLKGVSKRDARQFLRELPEIHPFVEAYVMLFALEGHAVPLDEEILAYLKSQEVVEEESTLEDAQRFVEYHLKAEEVYDFFISVRRAAHGEGSRKKAKA